VIVAIVAYNRRFRDQNKKRQDKRTSCVQTEEKTTISHLATNVALLVVYTHKTIVYEMLHT